jgi:hypothetical protein
MIALNRPEEKDIVCALVANMLETRGDCLFWVDFGETQNLPTAKY